MSTGDERDIQRAIEIGEKNRQTKELILRWCKHARVEKFGGTGIVEMQTGLPIGAHSMACDYAPIGGSMATWDMEHAAINFYDKHCTTCKQRSPVGMPNLSALIDARDRAVKQQQKDITDLNQKLKAATDERRQKRATLRASLAALPATIIDQLDELDANPGVGASQPLLETARMAPEVFTPEIIELFFDYLESKEVWFCDTGLEILPLLNTDKKRLGRLALQLAKYERFTEAASKAIVACISEIDATLIDGSFDTLVELASPTRTPFSNYDGEGDSEALLALYGSYTSEVEAVIRSKLRGRSPREIVYASTAIRIIAENNPKVPFIFLRDILTKLTRAESLVDFDAAYTRIDDHTFYASLCRVLELSLVTNAKETDALVASFLTMANPEAQKRVAEAYIRLLPNRYKEDGQRPAELYVVIIDRLLELASSSTGDEIIMELGPVFRGDPAPELNSIVIDKKSHVLGIAILLDDKRERLSHEMGKVSNMMESWEIGNRHDSVVTLQKGLVGWVSRAASEDAGTAIAYIETLNRIPEEKFYLRGVFVECLSLMGDTPEGLATAIPNLYTAILGSDQWIRARALRALEKLGPRTRNDLPSLMLEAMVLALSDRYVIVHKQAVSTLEKFKIPGKLRQSTRLRLICLVEAYANNKKERKFFIECATHLLSEFTVSDDGKKRLGKFIVNKLRAFDSDFLLKEIDDIYWPVKGIEGLPGIVIPLLGDADGEHQADRVAHIISRFSREELLTEKDSLRQAAQKNVGDRHIYGPVIEILTFAGDYEGACLVAQNELNSIPDTVRSAQHRLYIEALLLAAEIEMKASKGLLDDDIPNISQNWSRIYKLPREGA